MPNERPLGLLNTGPRKVLSMIYGLWAGIRWEDATRRREA